jgi:hypothetical protein
MRIIDYVIGEAVISIISWECDGGSRISNEVREKTLIPQPLLPPWEKGSRSAKYILYPNFRYGVVA